MRLRDPGTDGGAPLRNNAAFSAVDRPMTKPDQAVPDTGARNAAIDLLRGLSILLVVMHHVALRIPLRDGALQAWLPRSVLGALSYNGYEAVFLFFVVSGFLIAGNAIDRWGSLAGIDLRAFYLRRVARILPCLLLLLGVLAALHLAGVPYFTIDREGQSLGRALLAVLGLHLNWYEGVTGYLPGNWDVLWSLSIEEAFYLGFPLLCLAIRRETTLLALLALLMLSLPIARAALVGNEIWQEKAWPRSRPAWSAPSWCAAGAGLRGCCGAFSAPSAAPASPPTCYSARCCGRCSATA